MSTLSDSYQVKRIKELFWPLADLIKSLQESEHIERSDFEPLRQDLEEAAAHFENFVTEIDSQIQSLQAEISSLEYRFSRNYPDLNALHSAVEASQKKVWEMAENEVDELAKEVRMLKAQDPVEATRKMIDDFKETYGPYIEIFAPSKR